MSAHTKGVFHASDWGYVIQAGTAVRVAASLREGIEGNANAELIAEAFNVATETGLTPRQLAEQRKELLGVLRELFSSYRWMVECEFDEQRAADHRFEAAQESARAAIAKATGATP